MKIISALHGLHHSLLYLDKFLQHETVFLFSLNHNSQNALKTYLDGQNKPLGKGKKGQVKMNGRY